MKKVSLFAGLGIVTLLVTGCASQGDLPLVFGQSHTVGISMSGSVPEQAADLTIGYKDKNIAVVPVQPEATAPGNSDALSTLGQFELNADANQVKAGLGKFFATGMAARVLSEGFRCAVSDGKHLSCTQH